MLDAGNVFGSSTGLQSKIKAEIAIEAMEIMGYDIFNLGEYEFNFGVDFLLNYTQQFNVPTMNANVVYEDNGEHITTTNSVKTFGGIDIGFAGIVSQDYEAVILQSNEGQPRSIMVEEDTAALQTEVDTIKAGTEAIVAITHAGMDNCIALAASAQDIDVIICGNGDEITTEPLVVNGVYIVKAGSEGKYIGNLELKFDDQNDLYEVINSMVMLDNTFPEDPTMLALIDEYHLRLEAHKDELLDIEQVEPDAGWYYVGSEECMGCHIVENIQWQGTDHVGALLALEQQGQEYNPECIICHTTGFGYTGGFVMSDTTPGMAGVQCEMCHGAGGEHATTENLPYGRTSESTCRACHTQERDPDFDYNASYLQVVHFPDDFDNDTVTNDTDNCPYDSNVDQEDTDTDTFGDACDNCPVEYNPLQEDTYPPGGNGCGDACECHADSNADQKVDLADLVVMKGEFLRTDCDTNPCDADCNYDNKVDLSDLVMMKTEFLRTDCPACVM